MKKRVISVLIVLCLAVVFTPTVSRAAVTPYFVAVNDTLLDFSEETMPFIIGGDVFVPVSVFNGVDLFEIGSVELEMVRLYRGAARYVDFYTRPGETQTKDQDNNTLYWPAARRIGRRFYVPLRQVCDYFGLTPRIIPVSRDIIANEQMYVVRIISSSNINDPTFVGLNRNTIRNAYNEYHAPPSTPSPGETPPPSPIEEPPPTYEDVTIHLSFYDISAGSVDWILNMLDTQVTSEYRSCFFVSADDIYEDPGLIRRIAGSGHTIGIRLTQGTYQEYLDTSALLFEATKIKTVLVLVSGEPEAEFTDVGENGLVLWVASQSPDFYSDTTVAAITAMIPTESGDRQNFVFSCSENATSVLPGIISYLHANEYNIENITETVEPV